MDITVSNRQKDLPLSKAGVQNLVRTLLSFLKVQGQVSVYFVTEKKICQLHKQFFDDPTPTDCISFPIDKTHLGEIFVCPFTAIQYAKKRDLDPYDETMLYVIHGLLHLLGFDDLEENGRRTMRKKEKSCMRHIKSQGISVRQK